MAAFLYQVGRPAFRRRWYVALVWAAVLALAGLGALKAPGAAAEGFSMPGIESQRPFDLLEQRFPGVGADGATARVLFVAPSGEKITTEENKQAVTEAVTDLADGPQVASAADPFKTHTVSGDGTTAYATVTYKVGAKELTDSSETRPRTARRIRIPPRQRRPPPSTALETLPPRRAGRPSVLDALTTTPNRVTRGTP